MSKNVKSKQKNESESHIQYPQQHQFDELAVMDDDVLLNLQKVLSDSISRVNSRGLNPHAWETELCYVQREVQIRMKRKELHEKYVASLSHAEVE